MANTKTSSIWLVILVIVAAVGLYATSVNNQLVKKDENVKLNWGNLQNTYQRRMDLVPNLVAIVKASSDYEKQTLQQVTEARANAAKVTVSLNEASFENYNKLEQAQAQMAISTNRAIALIENYPGIKSTKSFSDLQSQLEGTERRIKVARNDFNGAVAQYNQLVRKFPANIVASVLGFNPREGFKADTSAASAPEIKF